jgi:hypothetical protein
MTFDYIIILSAAAENIDGKFPNFLNGVYLGGEVRVKAAAKLLDEYPDTDFIVAGGYNEKNVGIAGTSKKVDDIVEFLRASNHKAKIQEVYSLPCTHHNFVAVFNYWRNNKISPKRVGILSNEYHLPRAMAFANILSPTMLPGSEITFVPLAAETVDASLILKLDEVSQAAYTRRLEYEKTGLQKIRSGMYADYCLTRDFELLKELIYENPDGLLTDTEKLALHL